MKYSLACHGKVMEHDEYKSFLFFSTGSTVNIAEAGGSCLGPRQCRFKVRARSSLMRRFSLCLPRVVQAKATGTRRAKTVRGTSVLLIKTVSCSIVNLLLDNETLYLGYLAESL